MLLIALETLATSGASTLAMLKFVRMGGNNRKGQS
jgi:hypothetical protein